MEDLTYKEIAGSYILRSWQLQLVLTVEYVSKYDSYVDI